MPKRATIYTYPWDLSDEGVDNALNTIADTAASWTKPVSTALPFATTG